MPTGAKLTIKGERSLRRKFRQMAGLKEVRSAVAKELNQQAHRIMARSRTLVPVDTGALRQSGHVPPPKQTSTSVTQSLAYGGIAAPYAVIQHERLDFSHTVGQAKYLEQPLLEAEADIRRGLRIAIDKGIRDAVGAG